MALKEKRINIREILFSFDNCSKVLFVKWAQIRKNKPECLNLKIKINA